jgi:hypothetical protein
MTALLLMSSSILLAITMVLYQRAVAAEKSWLNSIKMHTECIKEKFDCYLQIAKLEATIRSLEHDIALYEQMRDRTFDE